MDICYTMDPIVDTPRPSVSCICSVCPSCCRTVRVPITHRDLLRLVHSGGHARDSLIEWLAPLEIDMTGEPESFVELDVGRRLMVLRHDANACMLLDASGRCRSYPARPAACAAYPYALTDPESEDQPRRLFVLADAPCQQTPNTTSDLARQAAQCVEDDLNEYVTLVSRWNLRQRRRRFAGHRPRCSREFLEYLLGEHVS